MKRKLEIPWTARLPVVRWWNRRNSPFAAYAANHNLTKEEEDVLSRLTLISRKR